MKKKILFLSFLVIASVSIYNFYNTPSESSTPPQPTTFDEFQIGCMASYWDLPNHTYYDELGLNITHGYVGIENEYPGDPGRHTPKGWLNENDHLFSEVPASNINWVLDNMNSHNQSRFMWMRPKIEWLCYGQSSIYYCEDTTQHMAYADLWFYTYNDHPVGSTVPDNNSFGDEYVVYCEAGVDNTGFVVERLKANTEQCKRTGVNDGNQWQGDSECGWLVKPRIRIPQGLSDETDVCKIYIIMQDGITSKPTITTDVIKAKHFKNNQGQYDGGYLEEFYFDPPNNPTGISFPGDLGDKWVYNARGTCESDNNAPNKADIKIEWLGNCDMWLDYVKVENDVADRLLKLGGDQDLITSSLGRQFTPVQHSTMITLLNFILRSLNLTIYHALNM
jgi:hypothetical protein